MKTGLLSTLALLCGAAAALAQSPGTNAPYQTTGIKIGETTDSTAIVWTRLTRNPERVGGDAEPIVRYRDPKTGELSKRGSDRPDATPVVEYPNGVTIEGLEGAVPGMPGCVRVFYQAGPSAEWQSTAWEAVDPAQDFTRQFTLTDLQPATRYAVRVESRGDDTQPGQTVEGEFQTASRADDPHKVTFMVTTGQAYPDQDAPGGGYRMYASMLQQDPDFFVHTGDIIYYDAMAKSEALARWHWDRMYSLPTNVAFHRRVGSYFIKDDHDTWMNDCYPTMKTKFMGDLTFAQGQAIFLQEVPMGERTYRTVRWGKDLQIWLVEGRDFRSPNNMPDGPDKTIWGAEQKAWFKKTVQESDATFRVLISPTPLVGPDRGTKNDNHANLGFTQEGDELRAFIAAQKNMIVACGDRHWQYVSVDEKTGLREYSCGPASDAHAGGWSNDKRLPEHRYLNVIGGYLAVLVDRPDGVPTIRFQHHGVDGNILHEEKLEAR